MNSLKNLMIIGVLAAVGYGVYISLSRNNVDSEQPFGPPKVELSSANADVSPKFTGFDVTFDQCVGNPG